MTTAFYVPPDAFAGARVVLPEPEARHATRVLRLRAGAEIEVVDGQGGRYRVRLTHTAIGEAEGEVVAREHEPPPPPFTLALGVLKADERFEFALEKAVELGVTRLVPLLTARVEARRVRLDRLHAHALAAMKQSLRAHLPEITAPQALADVLTPGALLLHESAPAEAILPRLLPAADAPVTLLIGPEGGFSDAEVAQATLAGARIASLGPVRLRAETAAVVGATLVYVHRLPAFPA